MNQQQDSAPSLLLVDDDVSFCHAMSQALRKRGFDVRVAHDAAGAMAMAVDDSPEFAIVDLKMPGATGLELVKRLKELDAQTRIVVFTGYASIATAVEAIKLGATHYLSKPADADEVIAAFHRDAGNPDATIESRPPTVGRVEWEHIQAVLKDCQGNISEAARRLRMHRRSLQRKLAKKPQPR